jgi:hypothetical protein
VDVERLNLGRIVDRAATHVRNMEEMIGCIA